MSQLTDIHRELKSGPITAWDILMRTGSMRAAARIFDLRSTGLAIETRMVRRGRAIVAEYRLNA